MPPTTVLWIDDDQLLLGLGTEALEHAGYRVLTAADGATGLALAQQEHPDLILLDVIMPSMYGLEVCRALRADPTLAGTPIVLLTALPDAGVATMGAQVWATRVLRKPFQVEGLLQVLAELLGAGDKPSAPAARAPMPPGRPGRAGEEGLTAPAEGPR